MNISERIKELADKEKVSMYTISKETGISQSTLSRLINGKTENISRRALKILADYFRVGFDWLLTGDGAPYLDTTAERTKLGAKTRIAQYVTHKGMTLKEFAQLTNTAYDYWKNNEKDETTPIRIIVKALQLFTELNPIWVFTGEGEMLKSTVPALIPSASCEEGTPLLPVEAWGGSLAGSSIAVLAEQCKKYNVPISNIDYLIPIAGDSMMPDYCPGDIVAIKRINERAFIEWGKVYVLDTCNGVVIKEIQPSENEGYITCISRNKPEKYRPFEVNLDPEEFYGMYAVKGTIRLS